MKKLTVSSLIFLAIIAVFGLFSYLSFGELLYARHENKENETPFFAFDSQDDTENRAKAALPSKLDLNFPRKFDAFYNDSFPLRSYLIKRFHKLKKKIKDDPKVIAGLDNWMFFNSSPESVYAKTGNILGDFTGKTLLNAEDKDAFIKHMACQKKYFKDRNIRLIVMVPPNRMPLYSEFLPEAYRKQGVKYGRYEQIREILKDLDVEFIDLKSMFQKIKDKGQMFFKTDTHWTQLGAHYGFGALTEKMGYRLPEPVKVERKILDCGDIYKVSATVTKSCFDINDVPELPATAFSGKCERGERDKKIVCTNDKAPVKHEVLIIRDSMFSSLYDYVARTFKKATMLWRSMHTEEELFNEIKASKADTIIYEQGERFLLEMQNEAMCPDNIVKINRLDQRPKTEDED